ncbi:hypothetical protein QTG54_008316 [Skeletonema marinoi]|uniref:KOW domain-containing protein n=1 Tax=Skeletonema marinoi TaxID=267567 RepID=A0AAD8Y8P7_9STRA|nr:hypothetical protein QTG54_008316 [Skeletonema marinoi]
MAEEEAPPSPTSSNNNSRRLHSKIRIKSCISDLANLVGEITEVKRGGWFMTDNPKIVRPIRAREFDLKGGDDDNEGVKKDDDEEASHFSADDADNKDYTTDAAEDTKEPQKEEGDDDEEEEELSEEEKVNPEDSNNYDKDQFLQLGTTIKITSGEHKGRTCTISERRVGIFLKIAVGGDIRLMQPDEIEVIKFAADPPFEEEEEKKSGKKEKDFGHRKYIGASVRVAGAAGEAGRKQRGKEATVDNAFSGEWYLVSDPDIVKALDPAQFERKRDDDDYDSDEEEEEEEDQDFLSTMQFCGEASAEKPKKSLRTREKKVNYNENGESSDDMESWQDSEEEKEEKQKGKKKEEEVEDESDDASVASVRKPPATKPVVDVIETSEAPKEKMVDKAEPDEDAKMTTADSSDEDGDKKMEEEPVISAPVILHPKKADNNKVELLLSGMSHLPPDTKIEVFNRKTGLVMRGDEAILLKDLPAALLNHADYEPIVPTPQSATVGEADDKEAVAEELPVDPNFDPWDTSVLVGVTVVVKSGPYRGITAKIKEVRGSRWVLDHEAVTTTLRSSDCHFIDDGEADKDAIAAHYRTKKKVSMPSFVKHGVINVSGNRAIAAAAASVRRVGRTDSNVRVSNVVIPQTRPHTRVRASAVEGKRVLVTGGEFRGLSGTISSCIPGGWYLVSNLYDDDHELDTEIDGWVSSKTSYMQGRIQEQIKSRIHSKASELRMEKKRKDDQHQAKMRSI